MMSDQVILATIIGLCKTQLCLLELHGTLLRAMLLCDSSTVTKALANGYHPFLALLFTV